MKLRSLVRGRSALAAGVVTLAALSVTAMGVVPASAASIKVTYPVSGSAMVKKTNSSMPLGPGSFKAVVTPNSGGGDIVGDLTLPPATAKFNAGGIVPVTARVTVIPTGPTTGVISQGRLTTHTEANFQLSDIWAGGLLPIPVGDKCKTEKPVVIELNSEGPFTVFSGGPLSGSFVLPDFTDCAIFAPFLNPLVSGPDNTIKLDLGSPTQS